MVSTIRSFWDDHLFGATVVVFLFLFLSTLSLFLFSQGDPHPDDQYFHIKYAQTLYDLGWERTVNNFDWIYLSGHAEGSRYAVSLYQIALIPFTFFSDLVLGLKIADAFLLSVTMALFYYVLRKQGVKKPLFFSLAILVSSYFAMRLMLGRAYVLIIALVFLEMYFVVHRRYFALFVTALFHVLWHQSTYFMPLGIVGIVEMARYLTMHQIYFRNFLSAIGAIIIGMMFFPGYPYSIIAWFNNIISIQTGAQIEGSGAQALGGRELLSRDFMGYFAQEELLLFLLIITSIITIFIYIKKRTSREKNDAGRSVVVIWTYALFIFMISTVFATMTFSGRVFDFLIPTVFFLCAFLYTYFHGGRAGALEPIIKKGLYISIAIYVAILILNTGIFTYSLMNRFDHEPAKETGEWIQMNSDEGEKIFLYNWSYFPLIFFSNTESRYSTGIEPATLKNYDEGLYWKYFNIFRYNYYCEKMGDCREQFERELSTLKKLPDEQAKVAEKENSYKIIMSIRNEFDARFIVTGSQEFSRVIKLNPELIEDYHYVKSEKFKGESMEFWAFKLK